MQNGIELNTLEQARNFFSGDRFAADSGMSIAEAEKGRALIRLELDERHQNAMGGLMGGVLLTIADFACAVASHFGQADKAFVSADAHMQFLSGCRGKCLLAEAVCVKQGAKLAFYEVTITDELETPLAHASFTMCRVR